MMPNKKKQNSLPILFNVRLLVLVCFRWGGGCVGWVWEGEKMIFRAPMDKNGLHYFG